MARAPWNPRARLVCGGCGASEPLGEAWLGCTACGSGRPLVVEYGDAEARTPADLATALLPIDSSLVLELGQGRTPLLPAGGLLERTWLKLESQNPTGSHKDRFHAVALGVARALGYRAVVTSSTGNHGAAAAAFAASAGLRCLVCLHPESPPALRTQISSYGGEIAVVPDELQRVICTLVDRGWYPSTGADPALAGRANPYGQEGYRAIAFEIAAALPQPPRVVAVAAASGDTFYGVWRGFRDLHERLGRPLPTVLACQPAGAAPLALTARAGDGEPRVVDEPRSLALSARDERSGRHASDVLGAGAEAVEVPEEEIADFVRRLGRAGHCVEPAAALGMAGLARARASGLVDPDAPAVAIVTSSGSNWTRDVEIALGGEPRIHADADALLAELA